MKRAEIIRESARFLGISSFIILTLVKHSRIYQNFDKFA